MKQLSKIGRSIPVIRQLIKIHETLGSIQRELAQLRTIEAVRSYEQEWMSNDRFRDPQRLLAHARQVNSQNGEDGMIAEIFDDAMFPMTLEGLNDAVRLLAR